MATRVAHPKKDVSQSLRRIGDQFQGLNPNDPSDWPPIPRALLCLLLTVAVLGGLWYFWLSDSKGELETEQRNEVALRADYSKKLAQAVNLDLLKAQREQVQQYVFQLEKQLPSKAEMDALLSDINQAGLGRGLQFELFRPGAVLVKDYYAELPIALRITGRFNAIGEFVADVAHLSRIVTLNNLSIQPQKEGPALTMEATARTFRYLDPEEQELQQKAKAAAAAKAAKK
ncbi:MAG: type 4a pilus biogenesis protein PilO [Variovorax sp.]